MTTVAEFWSLFSSSAKSVFGSCGASGGLGEAALVELLDVGVELRSILDGAFELLAVSSDRVVFVLRRTFSIQRFHKEWVVVSAHGAAVAAFAVALYG